MVCGALIGSPGVDLLPENVLRILSSFGNTNLILPLIGGVLGLTTGFLFLQLSEWLMRKIRTMPADLLVSRSIGLILGLLIANLILAPVLLLPLSWGISFLKPLAAVLSNIFFGALGFNLGEVHGRTILRLFNPNSAEALLISEGILTPASAKILDTSVIIDGRIEGLLKCRILEGQVIIAQSVIDELQKLSDSSNSEKRSKGRRGLKLLKALREVYGRRLVVNNTRYEGNGTDERLLKLTSDTGGILITADFNLAQVAEVKELKVLNLNELVLALRPDVQPGASLNIKIIREGKEDNQGLGYLEDGTMVVVEQGKESIGDRIEVVVTGALQTSTGRIFFARSKKSQVLNKTNQQP